MESTALALPDEQSFRRDIQALHKFQQIVHASMIEGKDFGVIPGTQKPTLLKPGAEKIAKLLGLADTYDILDRQEDWIKPFFRYLVKCKLVSIKNDVVISEGLGECNSMESRYRYRWVNEKDLPAGIDKTKLVTQERTAKNGGHWTVYRMENEDIYSQVNTILKMAKKRSLVDAALSAGRLSDLFTQDMEDMPRAADIIVEKVTPAQDTSEHFCQEHGVPFFKKGKMKGYAHPIEGTDQWCNEETHEPQPEATESSPVEEVKGITLKMLAEKATEKGYDPTEVKAIMASLFHAGSAKELSQEQRQELLDVMDKGDYKEPETVQF